MWSAKRKRVTAQGSSMLQGKRDKASSFDLATMVDASGVTTDLGSPRPQGKAYYTVAQEGSPMKLASPVVDFTKVEVKFAGYASRTPARKIAKCRRASAAYNGRFSTPTKGGGSAAVGGAAAAAATLSSPSTFTAQSFGTKGTSNNYNHSFWEQGLVTSDKLAVEHASKMDEKFRADSADADKHSAPTRTKAGDIAKYRNTRPLETPPNFASEEATTAYYTRTTTPTPFHVGDSSGNRSATMAEPKLKKLKDSDVKAATPLPKLTSGTSTITSEWIMRANITNLEEKASRSQHSPYQVLMSANNEALADMTLVSNDSQLRKPQTPPPPPSKAKGENDKEDGDDTLVGPTVSKIVDGQWAPSIPASHLMLMNNTHQQPPISDVRGRPNTYSGLREGMYNPDTEGDVFNVATSSENDPTATPDMASLAAEAKNFYYFATGLWLNPENISPELKDKVENVGIAMLKDHRFFLCGPPRVARDDMIESSIPRSPEGYATIAPVDNETGLNLLEKPVVYGRLYRMTKKEMDLITECHIQSWNYICRIVDVDVMMINWEQYDRESRDLRRLAQPLKTDYPVQARTFMVDGLKYHLPWRSAPPGCGGPDQMVRVRDHERADWISAYQRHQRDVEANSARTGGPPMLTTFKLPDFCARRRDMRLRDLIPFAIGDKDPHRMSPEYAQYIKQMTLAVSICESEKLMPYWYIAESLRAWLPDVRLLGD